MGVTASALLAAGGGETSSGLANANALTKISEMVEPNLPATATEAASRYYYQRPQQPQQPPQTDDSRRVAAAAAVITSVLFNVQEQDALTLNQILTKRPDLDRRIAERALAGLIQNGQIRRTGDGTQVKPYRYYDKSRSGSGG